jgi:hypothetical protein
LLAAVDKRSSEALLGDYATRESNAESIGTSLGWFKDGGGFGSINVILGVRLGRSLALLIIKINID